MPEYRVGWSIDVTADSPREAAEEAFRIQQEGEACQFVVWEIRGGRRSQHSRHIDLNDEDEDRQEPTRGDA